MILLEKEECKITRYYEPEFKEKMVRLHLEEGHTLLNLQRKYKVSKAVISHWVKNFRNECQTIP
ncbi:transposase [Pectinatus frisingensis]|uniref:transposase n=1 Tax=Pectinatus frisingensis TaxID=865 RepID=UPI0039BF8FC5